MHEVYKEKKNRGGSGSDFVFLDGEGKRRGEQYRYIGGGEEAADELIEFLQGGCGRGGIKGISGLFLDA